MSGMRRAMSYFLSVLFLFVVSCMNVGATDFNVNVAVLCEDRGVASAYVHELCKHKAIERPMDVEFTSEENEGEFSTVIYLHDTDTNYHIKFHFIPENGKLSDLNSTIKKCSAAIVMYDISDSSLDEIVRRSTFYEEDVKELKNIKTPLVNYIVHLQGHWWNRNWWHNAINFITYGKGLLDEENYSFRREQLNDFTNSMERYFDVDNKWGRGHPDITNEKSKSVTLRWISGQAYRSISEGKVSGKADVINQNIKKKTVVGCVGIVAVTFATWIVYNLFE